MPHKIARTCRSSQQARLQAPLIEKVHNHTVAGGSSEHSDQIESETPEAFGTDDDLLRSEESVRNCTDGMGDGGGLMQRDFLFLVGTRTIGSTY